MPKKLALKYWHRAAIIAVVHKTGTSFNQLSVMYDLGMGVLRNCLNHSFPRYERVVAEHLNYTSENLAKPLPRKWHA